MNAAAVTLGDRWAFLRQPGQDFHLRCGRGPHVRSDHGGSRFRRPLMFDPVSPRRPPLRPSDRALAPSQAAAGDAGRHYADRHSDEHSGRTGRPLRSSSPASPTGPRGIQVGALLRTMLDLIAGRTYRHRENRSTPLKKCQKPHKSMTQKNCWMP